MVLQFSKAFKEAVSANELRIAEAQFKPQTIQTSVEPKIKFFRRFLESAALMSQNVTPTSQQLHDALDLSLK